MSKHHVLGVGYSLCTGPGCKLCALVNSRYRKQEVVPQVTNDFELVAQPTEEDITGRSASAAVGAPAPFTCTLCGQRIEDGQPCGCGARPLKPASVSIPKSKLREWRRGLMTMDTAHPLGQAHANEIIQEIEGYLQ